MKRGGFGVGRGGRASGPRGGPSTAPDSAWDTQGWGVNQPPPSSGVGRDRERDGGWSDRRPTNDSNDDSGWHSAFQSAPSADNGWNVPAVQFKFKLGANSGWGDIGKSDAPGWNAEDDPKTATNSGWDMPATPQETNAVSEWQTTDSRPAGTSPRKPSSDFADRGTTTTTSRRDREPVDKGKGRADTGHGTGHRRPSRSNLDSRDDAFRTPARPSKQPTRDDAPPLTPSDQPVADWSHVQRHRQRPASPTGTDNTTSTERLMAKILTSPSSAVNIKDPYAQVIALSCEAVKLGCEMHDAAEQLDRIKAMQISPAYEHIGQAGRKKLDGLRRTATENLELKKKLYADILRTLAKSDEAPRAMFLLDPAKVADEARSYTSEAIAWITTIRPNLIASERHGSKLLEPSSDPDVHLNSPPPSKAVLKRRRSSSPDSPSHPTLAGRLNDAEMSLEKLRDTVFENATHTRDTLDEKIASCFARLPVMPVPKSISSIVSSSALEDGECTPDPPSLRPPIEQRVDDFSRKVEGVAGDVSELARGFADLKAKSEESQKELQSLREESKALHQYETSLLDQVNQCERDLEQPARDLEQIATLLQAAIAQPNPTMQPNIIQHNLQDEINRMIDNRIKETVEPLIRSIHESCKLTTTEYKESTYQEFWDKVSGPLKMSEAITLILEAKGNN